jgi:hypothetical protein
VVHAAASFECLSDSGSTSSILSKFAPCNIATA